jgi:diacylglycerol kinase family enzyme
VFNPIKVDEAQLRADVAAAEQASGWQPTRWYPTSEEDPGQGRTTTALAEGAAVVLAAGGDGTVRAVAEALRDTGVAIALVPSGTGNLLARNLELALTDHVESIGAAFDGADRTIDLGIAGFDREDGSTDEHVFLVVAGLGIDAKMIAKTNPKLKKAVGWLAYIDGVGRALPELKPVKLRYRLDGAQEKDLTAHSVLVGNCGSLPGGILLMPDAKPDDGLLDIAVLRPRGPFGWLKVWNKIAWENGVLRKSAIGRQIIDLRKDVRDVTYVQGRQAVLALESAQEVQLDGDEFGRAIGMRVMVDPGALMVKVPAEKAHKPL